MGKKPCFDFSEMLKAVEKEEARTSLKHNERGDISDEFMELLLFGRVKVTKDKNNQSNE